MPLTKRRDTVGAFTARKDFTDHDALWRVCDFDCSDHLILHACRRLVPIWIVAVEIHATISGFAARWSRPTTIRAIVAADWFLIWPLARQLHVSRRSQCVNKNGCCTFSHVNVLLLAMCSGQALMRVAMTLIVSTDSARRRLIERVGVVAFNICASTARCAHLVPC